MRKLIIAAGLVSIASLIGIGAAPAAEQVQVTRTIYTLTDNPAFAAKVKAVCDDKAVKLSDKARAICNSGNFPNITKTTHMFRNAGVGAEFNTLVSQR